MPHCARQRATPRSIPAARGDAAPAFLLIQAAVGLAAHSATVYLAQPVVLSALWGIAYLGSVAVGRPLIGVFANAWYPFPQWFRASAPYRREFAMQSLVWGVYCLSRAGLRLAILLASGVGGFVLVSVATGTPVLVALVLWGIWHAKRAFGRLVRGDRSTRPGPEICLFVPGAPAAVRGRREHIGNTGP